MATTVIAAAATRAEREIVDHLRRARATSAESATKLPPLSPLATRRLRRLLHARAVREAPGGFWLDEALYAGRQADRRSAVIAVLVAILGIVIAVLLAQRAS